jgi:hypothetical protein
MWVAGAILAAMTLGAIWLVFRNVSASLDTTLAWLIFIGAVGIGFWLWRWTNAKRHEGHDVRAGFLLDPKTRPAGHAARAWKWMVVKKERDGLVGLAILCAIATSIASFYTTFMGSLSFFGLKPFQILFAFLLALGIQGALYIASWLVAEEAVTHARANDNRSGPHRWTDRPGNWFALKHRDKVAILLVCGFASVFFSFASHFENVYGDDRLKLANVQNARSDTTKVLVNAEKAIIEERNTVAARLKTSAEWATFNNGLEQLLRFVERQPDLLRKALNDRRATAEGELGKIRAEIETKGKALAEVNGKIDSIKALGAVPAAAQSADNANLEQLRQKRDAARERKLTFERAALIEVETGNDPANVPTECQAIARDQVNRANAPPPPAKNAKNAKQKAAAEARARTLAKSGPVHRCLMEHAKEAGINLRSFETEIDRIEKIQAGLATAGASRGKDIQTLEAERVRLSGEIAMLESRRGGAEQEYKAIQGGSSVLSGSDNVDLVKTIRADRDEFLRTGSRAIFDGLIRSCATLQQVSQAQQRKDAPASTQALAQQCDTSGLLAPIDRLATLNVALERYRASCLINQEFNSLGEPLKYVSKGSECLALAKVPERTVEESNILDRIAQLNHPATAPFERAVASLRRLDILAWLSAALAVSVDLLIFLSALLGAKANRTVLDRRGRVASTEERRDILAEDTDTRIYGDEPPRVLRAKLFLNAITYQKIDSADSDERLESVIDIQRIPVRHRTNVRNFLHSAGSAELTHPLNDEGLYRIDPDLQLHQSWVVGEFERIRTIEHGPRPLADDEDFSSVGEAAAERSRPTLRSVETNEPQGSPGAIGDHPPMAGSGPKRPAQTTPGRQARYGSGGWED